MMGERRVMQEALFYGFSLERRVPGNRLLRKIDRFVDLSEVDRALHSRSRSRQGPRDCKDRGLRCLTSRMKEGRDAVRSSEAHAQARSIAPAWAERGQRRVPLCRHSPKICGNWRKSSPFRRRSSPHKAKSQESASRIAPQIPSAGARTRGSSTKSTWSSHCPAPRRASQFRYIGRFESL